MQLIRKYTMFKILQGDYQSFGIDDQGKKTSLHHKIELFNLMFNQLNLFTFLNLDEIAIGEKYCISLEVGADFLLPQSHYNWMTKHPTYNLPTLDILPMPQRIWDDSKNGLVHWIVSWSSEGFMNDVIDFDKLLHGLNCQSHPQNLTYATGSEVGVPGVVNLGADFVRETYNINVINASNLFYFCYKSTEDVSVSDFISKKSADLYNKKINSYTSICYNFQPRMHRAIIIAHMQHRHHDTNSIHSYGMLTASHARLRSYGNHFEYLEPEFKSLISRDTALKTQFAEDDIDLTENQAPTINFEHALHSNFHIVTETVPRGKETINFKRTFITEKSYKPFYMMQPFIIFGNKHTIKTLKYRGYDTFDKWVDHSYDEVTNECDRLKMFLVELDRLHNISQKEWSKMLYDMLPGLLQNVHSVTRREIKSSTTDLTGILLKFFNT
jgi:hypothetical protein